MDFELLIDKIYLYLGQYISLEIIITIVWKAVSIFVILLIAHLILMKGQMLINHILEKTKYLNVRKTKTLQRLLKSIVRYSVYFFVAVIILYIFNVPVASLLAGAGIVGVAFGFGAQSLVRDIINGFFILFEDQFGVGDYIEITNISGIVEDLGLRSTIIRSFDGQLHFIPNGEITIVTNYSTESIRVLVDVGVSYDTNIDEAIEVLNVMCKEIAVERAEELTEGPLVLGVEELDASSVNIRIMARTKSMEQWQMARYIKKRIKEALDKNDIGIPYPHLTLNIPGEERSYLYEEEL